MLRGLIKQIDAYLLGHLAAKELEGWLLANLQTILASKDEEAIRIATALDADLMAWGAGHIDDVEFDEKLEAYARAATTVNFSIGPTTAPVVTSSGTGASMSRTTMETHPRTLTPVFA
jgi:hypothetical protein